MAFPSELRYAFKAWRALGSKPLALYAYHTLALHSGLYRLLTPTKRQLPITNYQLSILSRLPSKDELIRVLGDHAATLINEADEILSGRVRLFGGDPRPLELIPTAPLQHWTAYRDGWLNSQDIKLIWEPGRFGWATILARAYHLSGEEKYARSFWNYAEKFIEANSPNHGPHWASAQEVALRLISLSFCYSVFASSPETTPERTALFANAIAAHAKRIPPTLAYARAQNNNHLLTEAVGLYTAAAVLPNHPRAARWKRLGWRWLNWAFQNQIEPDGTYIQHSANYHRLMLQAALWAARMTKMQGDSLPAKTLERLAAATRWLLELLDEESGRVPNLGPNDGAYILPLTVLPCVDFRPVLQAAGRAFLGEASLPSGEWDEMSLWLAPAPIAHPPQVQPSPPPILRSTNSWAHLRVARFRARPGHSDQLHLDLWWRGFNVAQDAGTYLYNAPPPWDNSLSGASVHNTLTINGLDPMTRAGRFLWLDWAQAQILVSTPTRLVAEHNGYRRLGLLHRRAVEVINKGNWLIADTVLPDNSQLSIANYQLLIRLHWLLPDWPWELDRSTIRLQSPHGQVSLAITTPDNIEPHLSLARAGELLHGSGNVEPYRGWASPTYAQKTPALSFALEIESDLPVNLESRWTFPD